MTRRLSALLAAAQLADRDIATARAQADRDSKNFATATDALKSLLPAASSMADIYGKSADDAAMQDANTLVTENADTLGPHNHVAAEGPVTEDGTAPTAEGTGYADSPEELAKRLVTTRPKLQAPVKTGDVVQDFLADPLGIKARAAAKAQLAAEKGIVTGVHAARDKAQAEDIAAQQRAATEADKAATRGLEQKKIDASMLKPGEELDKKYFDLVKAGKGYLIPDDWWNEHFPGVPKPKPGAGGPSLVQQKNELEVEKLKRELGTDPNVAKKREDTDALRKEFDSLPAVKDFNNAGVALNKMKAAAANDSPAGDIALIYAFNKVQDPNSTVRESEFRTAAMAGDLGDKMQNLVSQVTTGTRLTKEQRADLLKQAQDFFAAHKTAYDAQAGRFADIGKRRGATIEDIVPSGSTITQRGSALPEPPAGW